MADSDAAGGDAIAISRAGLTPPSGGFVPIGCPPPPPTGADQFEPGPLSGQSEHFAANEGGLATTPGTAQFIYETDGGQLWWDADGVAGGARLIATVLGAPAATAAGIPIIA